MESISRVLGSKELLMLELLTWQAVFKLQNQSSMQLIRPPNQSWACQSLTWICQVNLEVVCAHLHAGSHYEATHTSFHRLRVRQCLGTLWNNLDILISYFDLLPTTFPTNVLPLWVRYQGNQKFPNGSITKGELIIIGLRQYAIFWRSSFLWLG